MDLIVEIDMEFLSCQGDRNVLLAGNVFKTESEKGESK